MSYFHILKQTWSKYFFCILLMSCHAFISSQFPNAPLTVGSWSSRLKFLASTDWTCVIVVSRTTGKILLCAIISSYVLHTEMIANQPRLFIVELLYCWFVDDIMLNCLFGLGSKNQKTQFKQMGALYLIGKSNHHQDQCISLKTNSECWGWLVLPTLNW